MNNQLTTTLILVCLIALFSLRHHTLQINQTSQGTEISFGNISLSFGEPEEATAQTLDKDIRCLMGISDPQFRLAPTQATILTDESPHFPEEMETVIQRLSQVYEVENRSQAVQLEVLPLHRLENPNSDINNQQ